MRWIWGLAEYLLPTGNCWLWLFIHALLLYYFCKIGPRYFKSIRFIRWWYCHNMVDKMLVKCVNKDGHSQLYWRACNMLWTLLWRHSGCDGVSNHQPNDCLLNRSFRPRSKKTSKLRVTDICAGNSPVTGEFPAQMASNAENVSIWWRHHDYNHDGSLLGI